MSHPQWSGNLLPCEPLSEETLKKAYDACVEMDQNLERRTETMEGRDGEVTNERSTLPMSGGSAGGEMTSARREGDLEKLNDYALEVAGRLVVAGDCLERLGDRLLGCETGDDEGPREAQPDPVGSVAVLAKTLERLSALADTMHHKVARLERL